MINEKGKRHLNCEVVMSFFVQRITGTMFLVDENDDTNTHVGKHRVIEPAKYGRSEKETFISSPSTDLDNRKCPSIAVRFLLCLH